MTDFSSRIPQVGAGLAWLERLVTQEDIHDYARATGDFNPVHLDESFAAETRFGRRIAHGMMILAFAAEMLEMNFPEIWTNGGSLSAQFKAPAIPGEVIRTGGSIVELSREGSGCIVIADIFCHKPDGSEAIKGKARIPYKGSMKDE